MPQKSVDGAAQRGTLFSSVRSILEEDPVKAHLPQALNLTLPISNNRISYHQKQVTPVTGGIGVLNFEGQDSSRFLYEVVQKIDRPDEPPKRHTGIQPTGKPGGRTLFLVPILVPTGKCKQYPLFQERRSRPGHL